jgi:carboxypeptidase T
MMRMMAARSSILLSFLLLAVTSGSASITQPETAFPLIATAMLPKGSDAVYTVDFLGVVASSEGVQKDSNAKIKFLVHHKEELAKLSADEGLVDVKIDHELSAQFKLANKGEQQPRREQEADTYSTVKNFPCIRDLAASYKFMNDIVATRKYQYLTTLIDIGDTYLKTINGTEGYDMLVLKITADNGVEDKAPFYAQFGVHAREMGPPELGMRFAEMLLEGYGVDAEITGLLDSTEIHLVLQANPDGRYVAETQQDLFRRKNVRPDPEGAAAVCSEGLFGVDLNRNFPWMWGKEGSSANPCSNGFRGTSPGSEPEVQAIVAYTTGIFPTAQVKAEPEGEDLFTPYPETSAGTFFDVHSYGELNYWPWGWIVQLCPNEVPLETMVRKFKYFNNYTLAGPGYDFLYVVSGDGSDWAYGTLGAAGVGLELGTDFYQNCPYFESNVVPDNLPVLLYGAKVARAPYSITIGPDVTKVKTAIEGSILNIIAESSDSLLSMLDGVMMSSSGGQSIASVTLFVDEHPYHATSSMGVEMQMIFETAIHALDLSTYFVGRHIFHLQATDSDGYTGPIYSEFFEGTKALPPAPTPGPTPGPTGEPTTAPSAEPSAAGSMLSSVSGLIMAWMIIHPFFGFME